MAAPDPFDLVKRLGNVPLGPLVEALRQMHRGGAVNAPNLEELLGTRIAAPIEPQPSIPTAAPKSPDYEAARKHFVQHSERLREQAMLAERLLDGLAGQTARAPTVLQHELRIQCAPGAASAARFVVVNCLPQPVEVLFRPGRFHGLSTEQASSLRMSFSPAQPRLEPGAEQEVQLLIDLAGSYGLPDVIEVGVDVLGDEQMLLKLWARIELRQGGSE